MPAISAYFEAAMLNWTGGVGTATQPTAPPKTSAPASSSSSGMVVIGVAAAAGIGLLGYELWKRAAARAVRAAR